MTGGIFGSDFSETAGVPYTYQQPKYARLPKDANERLVQDTIYLDDPAFVLPNRSQARRRAFRNLQNRYYRQILCGCTNPCCKTPTCLSRQKRVSKGPFRPYTVLSARTLATFLASEDHPHTGLCPHPPANLEASAVSGLEPSWKDAKLAQKLKTKLRTPPRSPKSSTVDYATLPGGAKPPVSAFSMTTLDGSTHIKTVGQNQRHIKSESMQGSTENQKMIDRTHKEKDSKSFAQSLFDTAAMTLLHLADVPDSYLSWLRWIPREQCSYSHRQDDKERVTVIGGQDDLSHKVIENPAPQGLEYFQDPVLPGQEPKESANVIVPEQIAISLNSAPPSLDLGSEHDTEHSSLDNDHEGASSDHNDNCEYVVSDGVANSRIELKNSARGDIKSDAATVMEAAPDSFHSNQHALQTASIENGHVDDARPQSLSHFTASNIQALVDTVVLNYSGLFEEHRLLRTRGRIDTPLQLSSSSPDEVESYRKFLAYSAQSMTYVLSNAEALMQSFVHCDTENNPSRVVRSYALPLMVRCFRQLRGLNYHPSSILPNLWVSAGYVYPHSSLSKKNVENQIGNSPLGGIREYLRYDVEACHIAKIIFGALVASVPECTRRTWSALSKLRATGQVAPNTPSNGSIAHQKMVRAVLNTGAAFENEMALGVMTRLVRAIAARHSDIEIDRDSREYSVIYTAYTIRYLIAESFKVVVTDHEAPLPSVKAGKLNMDDKFQASEGLEKPFKVIIEWLRSVILKEWDGKPIVRKCSAVGGALDLLRYIQLQCFWFDDEPEIFHTPFLSDRLEVMEMPPAWIDFDADRDSAHVLDYAFLFAPSVLVTYFRAINHAAMYKAFEDAAMAEHLATRMTFTDPHSGRGAIRLHERLRIAQSNYLVLDISRKAVLTDAMNQLWRRQKRELMRPLKVRMGMEEGEEGVDLGGVQQEFFRVAIAEAMNPEYGAFTTDPTTHMSWFQPGSLEPLYKFELLGLLTSLAVYNGLTLPFTFPYALYRKLLNLPILGLVDIEDGWPELTKSLRILRDWPEDNVEDVFMRPFVFSVNVFGTTVDVDMDKARKTHFRRMERAERWRERRRKNREVKSTPRKVNSRRGKGKGSPSSGDDLRDNIKGEERANDPAAPAEKTEPSTHSSSSENSSGEDEAFHRGLPTPPSIPPRTRLHGPDYEPIMVNNANRGDFIRDYILHLTHFSIKEQFSAFAQGFFTCINARSLSLFTPSTLKALVEGLPDIDTKGLEHVTRYEGGFHEGHPTIRQFWRVVRSWPQPRVRQLLEFVTSSDRLPVGGVERLVFVVQKNGVGDGRLPSSSTCFGRLLLPEYSSEDNLRAGLETAVENSKGFGQP